MKTLEKLNETKTLFSDLDKPSLHALSYALRHPDTWPKDFEWNYSDCNNCAMGLAHQLWKEIPEGVGNRNKGSSIMAKAFGISFESASCIFYGQGSWTPTTTERMKGLKGWLGMTERMLDLEYVTPEMVADQIDKYLIARK